MSTISAGTTTPTALSLSGDTTGALTFQVNGTTTAATLSAAGNFSLATGNLTFSSTGQRITGDMSNATLSNRLAFQTSTTNGNTTLNIIPNGTGTASQYVAHMGSDPANTSRVGININSSQSAALVFSDITGTGTYLPMTFYTGGSERMRLDTSGFLGLGTASPNITGFASSTSGMTIKGSSSNGRGIIELASNGTTGNGNSLGDIYFYDNTSLNARITGARDTSTTTGYLAFYTNGGSGNTERMRIDSSGNVGIGGTADARTKLQIAGTLPTDGANSLPVVVTGTIPSGTNSQAQIFRSNPTTQATSFTLSNLGHFVAGSNAFGAGSTVVNQYGFWATSAITNATNNYGFFSDIASGSNRWNFYAAGTAQNYFAGDVGIGRTPAASTRLTIKGQNNGTGNFSVYVENSTPTEMFKIRDDGTFYTGLAGNSPYNLTTGSAANVFVDSGGILRRSTSSLRYKSNVADATHGLADVLKLRSVTYKAKNSGNSIIGGLIAEEVHDAGLTEFVAYDNEGRPDALHYGNMVALAFKAIQELKAENDALKARIEALETK